MVEKKGSGQKSEERKKSRVYFGDPLVDFEVRQVGTQPGPFAMKGKVVNLSDTGAGLKISQDSEQGPNGYPPRVLEEGAYIQFRVSVLVSGAQVGFPLLGQVVWVRPGENEEYRIGVRYIL